MPRVCSRMTRASPKNSILACGCATSQRANPLLRKPEHFLGLEKPTHRVKAERDEGPRADLGESARNQDRPQQPLRQALDPRGEIDRRADHRKVEPVGGADIA